MRGSNSTQRTDSYDKTKLSRFLNTVVATNNTEKVVETGTCDDGEDVEYVISKAFKCVHV